MRKLILKLAKHYILKAINETLSRHQGNIPEIARKIDLWTSRLQRIIIQLQRINERMADCRVDIAELDQTADEIETVIRSFG